MCDNLVYTLKDTYYMLGTGELGKALNADPTKLCVNLRIPYSFNQIPITHVGDSAFTYHPRLKTIYFPSTIIYLGYDCFGYIPNLESATFEERNDTALTFGQGVFAKTKMKIIRLPSKIASSSWHVFMESKIEKVIYCGMAKINGVWFTGSSAPIIYVHPLYPYDSFANYSNLVFTDECGIFMKCFLPSARHVPISFFRLSIPLLVIIFV